MAVVNKNRKERVAAGRANPPTKEELQQVHWIRCCECGKHRALPQGVTMDEMLEMYGLQHVSWCFLSDRSMFVHPLKRA